MKGRLAWALGGFVLVALVVYRFLTRVPPPVEVPPPRASATADTAGAGAAPAAAAPVARAPWQPAAADAPCEATVEQEIAVQPTDEEGAAGNGPAGASAADDLATGDPDERIEALRRKLEAARETAPAEPPLDERRRSVHDAGRAAAEEMRRAAERPARGSDASDAPSGRPEPPATPGSGD